MPEKVTYNIKNVYTSKITISEAGTVSYGTPVALPGATEIALPISGETVKKYADGKVWVRIGVNNGYDGNLSVYNIPDTFAADYLGMTVDSNGVLVEKEGAVQSAFALIFEFDTDTADTKRNVLYNCFASRPEINSATSEDTIDPQPFSIPITAAPADDTGNVKASIVGDSTDSTWSGWFSSVYVPAAATQYEVDVLVQVGTTAIADALVVCGSKFARTDSAGHAYFMQPAGTYDILVSDGGTHTADVDTVTVTTADVTKTITLV